MKIPLSIASQLGVSLALSAPTIRKDMDEASKQGRSRLLAGTASFVRNNWTDVLFLGMNPAAAIGWSLFVHTAPQIAPALVNSSLQYLEVRQTSSRLARVPFSHKLEHTQYTTAAMQAGLSAIGNTKGILGGEASIMAARVRR